jgi:hypothetical protein
MSDDPNQPAPRRPFVPLMDRLGEMCTAGRDATAYLWQVPADEAMRARVVALLAEIRTEALKSGRREMTRLVEEMQTAAAASPSPQQVEILQDGFDRLMRLWQAAKSGIF